MQLPNPLWASSKILINGPEAMEEQVKYGALTEHQIIPRALQRTTNCCRARRSTTKQNGAPQTRAEHL